MVSLIMAPSSYFRNTLVIGFLAFALLVADAYGTHGVLFPNDRQNVKAKAGPTVPVLLMHGILANEGSMADLQQWILKDFPNAYVYDLSLEDNVDSVVGMWDQVAAVREFLTSEKMQKVLSNGYHVVAHSQGGILFRGLIESWSGHKVKNFITLSSPLAGQFGETDYLKYIYPVIPPSELYHLFYTSVLQDELSIAGYWRDMCEYDEYLEGSTFLAALNNEVQFNSTYKENFLKLENIVAIGGPDDGVIEPWESANYGFFAPGSSSTCNSIVKPMEEQTVYTKDLFGLKTLDERGSIHRIVVPGIEHTSWETTYSVYEDHVKPWLT